MMFVGLALTSCEPMEDIHDEIDAELEGKVAGTIDSYTLTEDDYKETLELDFTSFNTVDDAKSLIPVLLDEVFPSLGGGSAVNVHYNLYDPINVEEYTMAAADYGSANYFTEMSDIQDFLSEKYSQAENGDYVELTYNFLSDVKEYTLDDDDFDEIGDALDSKYPDPASNAAQYSSFELRSDDADYWSNNMILEALGVAISAKFGDIEGQIYEVSYDTYDGGFGSDSMKIVFDGNAYTTVGAQAYTLSYADYDYIETTQMGTDYPGPTGNAAQFSSFDVVDGSDNYWSDAMILEAINEVLLENFPSASEGDQFNVTVKRYLGGGQTDYVDIAVVLQNGAYVEDDAEPTVYFVEKTDVFAYSNGDWIQPLTLPSGIYTEEFNQSYGNFGDVDDMAFYVSRYLDPIYPYAEEGDLVPVAYKYYNGERTVTAYANFVYENGDWNYIPSVIEQSLQFGHNGTVWEPDNTIRYSLSGSDYTYIAETFAEVEGFEAAASNLSSYGNFNTGTGASGWSDEMLLEAFDAFLDHIAPNAEEGQKYILSFTVYRGGYSTREMSLIKTDGEWVLNE